MSEDKPHGASTIRPKHEDKGGGAGKWLAGAAIAAVLLGGGYYAWSTYSDSPTTQSAQNEAFDTDYQYDPDRAAPIDSAENDSDSIASPDESVTAAPASADSAPARTTRRAAATPARAVAAEETIGVSTASADVFDEDEIVITGARRPIWESTPSARRLSALYPQRALDRGREGEASLQCTVQENGRLDCVPVSETPARAGFGTAAVRVARTFRHAPQLADGSDATGSAVNLRVVFRMADEDDRRRG